MRVCAIIPTFIPSELTYTLVKNLLRWNPALSVYVVDDCTPQGSGESAEIFARIRSILDRVTLLCTPVNKLKAGALNCGIEYIQTHADPLPDIILTLDDDVVINAHTVKNLVKELRCYSHLGAVCSQSRVLNKNVNLLTRLQGLEYLGFNAIRLADEGFIRGPLVMHGMLTAFRAKALIEVGGFKEGHLIEDYEITTRLKNQGWSVRSVPHALAWTHVPEKLSKFWHQRTRWSYGGIIVVTNTRRLSSVFQDLLGHGIFFATLGMLIALMVSQGGGALSAPIAQWIIAISLLQLLVSYVFQLWLMRLYKERDVYDWIIRIALIPEFIYGYIMTTALLGSYLFYGFTLLKASVVGLNWPLLHKCAAVGDRFFRRFGYTQGWASRNQM